MAVLFTQLDLLGPDDLRVELGGEDGSPFDPFQITYTFYRRTVTRGTYVVGAPNRVPMRESEGVYYVGEKLSSEFVIGDYYIEWQIRRLSDSPREIIGKKEFAVQGFIP